ncbi:MAG TPA: hypothetical protein VGN51_12010 [Acidimicrobiia bacterium]|jgi:catechol 2,3-dioxygenase-like lactoylglutathione lyase family enzyme
MTVSGFDHVSLPLRDDDAVVGFYRALGLAVDETEHVVVVHFGEQMINFHRAEMWTRADFTLRAPRPRASTSAIPTATWSSS